MVARVRIAALEDRPKTPPASKTWRVEHVWNVSVTGAGAVVLDRVQVGESLVDAF